MECFVICVMDALMFAAVIVTSETICISDVSTNFQS